MQWNLHNTNAKENKKILFFFFFFFFVPSLYELRGQHETNFTASLNWNLLMNIQRSRLETLVCYSKKKRAPAFQTRTDISNVLIVGHHRLKFSKSKKRKKKTERRIKLSILLFIFVSPNFLKNSFHGPRPTPSTTPHISNVLFYSNFF